MKEPKFKPAHIIKNIERILLGIIALLTVVAVLHEIYSIDYIKSKLKDFINIDKTDTQIIVTGTNTSGCVYKSKSIGAYHWSKAGFKTKIYLPMTIEYELKGINDLEKNINGFATLYNEIKKDKRFDIDIVKNFNDLKLPV